MVQINSCTIYGVGRKATTPPTPNMKPIQEHLENTMGNLCAINLFCVVDALPPLQTILELPIEIFMNPTKAGCFQAYD